MINFCAKLTPDLFLLIFINFIILRRYDDISMPQDKSTHCSFQMRCCINGMKFPPGEVQKSKKSAKHAAARKAVGVLLGIRSLRRIASGRYMSK